ncbi:MAG: hypothetical protein GXO78_12740 [Calditrichaeota bacterium]|nr:hypothetical protein [Calditrichota bacterium]
MSRYRYWGILIVFLVASCGQLENQLILNELRQMEYTRQPDSTKLNAWIQHPDWKIRLATVDVLGRLQDTRFIPLLADRLSDKQDTIRLAAIFALGQTFSPQAETVLLNYLNTNPPMHHRRVLLDALGKCGTDRSFSALRRYLFRNVEPNAQFSAAIASGLLAYRNYPPYNNGALLEILLKFSSNPEVRWSAAYALFRMASPTSLFPLLEARNDPDGRVRHFAYRGLERIISLMNQPDFKPLRKFDAVNEAYRFYKSRQFTRTFLQQEPDSVWFAQLTHLQLLERTAQPDFQRAIARELENDHPYVVIQAIRSLSTYRTVFAINQLRKVLRDAVDWRIRGEALVALARLRPTEALRYIDERYEHTPWPQNVYFIRALQEIQRKEATEMLLELADSRNFSQVSMALEALKGRPEVTTGFLIEKLRLLDPAITTIAAIQMSVLKDTLTIQPLLEVYAQLQAPRDVEAMEAIIRALDSLNSHQAIPLLEKELRNPFPPIRLAAHRALMRILQDTTLPLPETPTRASTRWDFPPIDPHSRPRVLLKTTEGNILIELYPDKAPITVANFLHLVQQGFYNGLFFHRVVPGFVIQGGDPRGDGWGGPGYAIPCEYNDLFYDRGVVGMAHAGKDTGGSQFFITHTPQPHLNGRYTAFGRVIQGMDVVDRILPYDKIIEAKISNY